jgi:SNF2 family DNA or RNA helicase
MNVLASQFYQTEMGRQKMAKPVRFSPRQIALTHLNVALAALALEALHKQVLPFLLRRLKEDVLHDLPPKIIQDYYCDLSDLQKYLYDDFSKSQAHVAAEDIITSTTAEKNGGQQHIFQSLQYLRKLCNHPALVLKNDTEAISAALEKVGNNAGGLSDIAHAPKLLALRYSKRSFAIHIYSDRLHDQTTLTRLWDWIYC